MAGRAGLAALARPWSGPLLRAVSARSRRSPLDEAYLGRSATNRWNRAGVPAYYFASSLPVIAGEWARHIGDELPTGSSERIRRRVYQVDVTLRLVLDLRDPDVIAAAGAAPIRDWILDRDVTQATSAYLRAQTAIEGLIVPSVAFLDRPDQFDVVVYRDRIDPRTTFGPVRHLRDIVLEAAGASEP